MALEINDISAGYEGLHVLWNINIRVDKGQRVSLVGSNGGGKSTLLKTVAGLLKPFQGRIILDGFEITGLKPSQIVKRGICLIPEGYKLFTGMTVQENLIMGAYLEKDKKVVMSQIERIYDIFPELQKMQHQLAGTMSGGEQQMCSIGRALMSSPQVLLIDELSLGLAPILVEMLIEKIKDIHERTNMSLLLVEQDVETAFSIADFGYVLESGKITLSGDPKELIENPVIVKSYLGL